MIFMKFGALLSLWPGTNQLEFPNNINLDLGPRSIFHCFKINTYDVFRHENRITEKVLDECSSRIVAPLWPGIIDLGT